MSNEELVAAVQSGAPERMSELWGQVRRFVIQQARRVPLEGRADCELDDLIQSGYLALADAVADYQPEKGGFLTVLNYHLKTQFAIATRFRTERQQREAFEAPLSLDAPLSDEADSATLGDLQEDPAGTEAMEAAENRIYHAQLQQTVASVLADLPENQRELLRLRYWESMSLDEISHQQGADAGSIRNLEKKIIRQLRKPATATKLRPFCDFDFYGGTGLGSFMASGASIQERYLMKQERLRNENATKQ